MRKSVLATVAALMVASAAMLQVPVQAHHKPSFPGVNVQPPCTGYWDKFGGSSPRNHHIVVGGDWSVDYFCSPGTAAQARAWPVSQQGAVAYRIAQVSRACRSGNYSMGGDAVKVEFHYGGYNVGFAWFLHLARVQVQAGQWVGHGATLGYTSRFTRNSCYDVSNDGGVHTHFELTSNRHWACYINRGAGARVNYWDVIGRIGGDYARTTRQACP